LFARYALSKLRRVPLIGFISEWGLTFAGLPLLARHQRATEALFAAADHAAAEADRTASDRVTLIEGAMNHRIDQLDAAHAQLRSWLNGLQVTLNEVRESQHGLAEAINSTSKILNDRYDEMAFMRQRLYALNHWGHSLTQAFDQIAEVADERSAQLDGFAGQVALEATKQDAVRDTRNAEWIEPLFAALPVSADIMTLACGYDWANLLSRHGARTVAIEPNRTLAEAARSAGLTVERTDAADALRRAADTSLDAITVLALPSVLRRLPVVDFFGEARRILRPGGVLLLAFAWEPATIVDALLEPTTMSSDAALLTHALSIAGFVSTTRVDAADGTVALLTRNAKP
jgi:SAM-dependent methyltransferase